MARIFLAAKNFLRHYWITFSVVLGTVGAVIGILRAIDWLSGKIGDLTDAAIAKHSSLTDVWITGMATGLVLLIIFIGTSFVFGFMSFRHMNRGDNVCRTTVKEMIHAAARISAQSYRPRNPQYVHNELNYTFSVNQNGDTHVRRIDKIVAHDDTLRFYIQSMWAEKEAQAIEYLHEIDFKIKDQSDNTHVAFLLANNNNYEKNILVFFLPAIIPGEEPRSIEASYCWPGMFNRLLTTGEETWRFHLGSIKKVAKFKVRFLFHSDLGKVDCDVIGRRPDTFNMERITSDDGRVGWQYEASDAPTGDFKYEFLLTSRNRTTPKG